MNGYVVIKEIGTGSFGRALKARPREGLSTVVIKRIDLSILSLKQKSEAINEVNVLRELRHPYIIKHLANFIECGHLHIVMEFADAGDLGARIKAMRGSGHSFTEPQISRWFTQILLGLSFIHGKNIMHRDLKPQNLFIASNGDRMLIGDFGVCKVMESKQDLARTMTGTPYYLSPEVFQNKPYSFKSDIWAIGCILYEMATLKVPFDAFDMRSLSLRVCRGSNPSIPVGFSSELRATFHAIMQRDHHSRPSADALLARPFIRAIVDKLASEGLVKSKSAQPSPYTPASARRTTRSVSPAVMTKVSASPRPPLYSRKSENIPSRPNVMRTPSPAPRLRSASPKFNRPPLRSLTPQRKSPSPTVYPPSPLKQRIVL